MQLSEYPSTVDPAAQQEAKEVLFYALYIGEQMLISGAEVARVEDSMRRICFAYGAEQVDVFTITSSIVATIYSARFGSVTQTRRVPAHKINMNRIDRLNDLCRRICRERMPLSRVAEELKRVEAEAKPYALSVRAPMYVLAPFVFSLFFGGALRDGLCAAVIGLVILAVQMFFDRFTINRFVATFVCATAGGLFVNLASRLGLAASGDLVGIGIIMLLIPGMALTNAARDLFSGDTICGLLRFVEVIMISGAIAVGFGLAGLLIPV